MTRVFHTVTTKNDTKVFSSWREAKKYIKENEHLEPKLATVYEAMSEPLYGEKYKSPFNFKNRFKGLPLRVAQ